MDQSHLYIMQLISLNATNESATRKLKTYVERSIKSAYWRVSRIFHFPYIYFYLCLYVYVCPLLLDKMDMIILIGSKCHRSWVQGGKYTSFGLACKWAKIDCSERVQCVLPCTMSLVPWIWNDCSQIIAPDLWGKTGWFS